MVDFFKSVGEFNSVNTLVDFYQYIKGVEYLICLAFFAGFPLFYKYLHGRDDTSRKRDQAETE